MKRERHSQLCNHTVESGHRPQRRCLEPALQVYQPFCPFLSTTGLLGTSVAVSNQTSMNWRPTCLC